MEQTERNKNASVELSNGTKVVVDELPPVETEPPGRMWVVADTAGYEHMINPAHIVQIVKYSR